METERDWAQRHWTQLSWQERREERFRRWLSPRNVSFATLDAAKAYRSRVERFITAIKLEEPDRVPVMLPAAFYPAVHAGSSLKKVMYDYDELRRAWLKFLDDFEMDTFAGPGLVFPGKVLDMLQEKIQCWPGHGLADDASTYQFVEGEYMGPDEYDAFIKNPVDFQYRTFMPRVMGGFAGFGKLSPMRLFPANPIFFITQFADPDIRAATQVLLDAAEESARWLRAVMDVSRVALEKGVPALLGGMSGAPYDFVGDMLRGTKGIMLDMYKRPDKLLAAVESITPLIIEAAVARANMGGSPIVMMPLHKGTGGFMSNKQFETFYWPTLKRVMMGLIEEGLVPMPFAEGDYMPRLEIIKDMPRSSVVWYFEAMDMAQAKKVLGDTACIAGNLPVSVLCTGTAEQVKEGCRRLIETCGPGGGYILTAAAAVNETRPENLRAMMEAAKEYGTFGKKTHGS